MFFRSFELKYIFLFLIIFSGRSFAECLKSENIKDLIPQVEYIKGVLEAGEMHIPLGKTLIELPESYRGMKLQSLRVTEGEVAEFYIPLEFKLSNGVAKSYILGSKSSLKNFELEIVYTNSSCSQFMQIMLLSEH